MRFRWSEILPEDGPGLERCWVSAVQCLNATGVYCGDLNFLNFWIVCDISILPYWSLYVSLQNCKRKKFANAISQLKSVVLAALQPCDTQRMLACWFLCIQANFWTIFLFCFMFFTWSGLCAEEIHVCGEPAAISFITELMFSTGEEVEVSLFFGYVQISSFNLTVWHNRFDRKHFLQVSAARRHTTYSIWVKVIFGCGFKRCFQNVWFRNLSAVDDL